MKIKNLYLLFIIATSFVLINCSEVKEDIVITPALEGVHPDGFAKLGSSDFHSFKIQADNWDLENCQKCHASDYTGGTASVSCLDCHTSSSGPEACNTCHGVFADETKIAPPNDINNNYATSAKGVGAHTAHVYENSISLDISCFECHPGNTGAGDFVKSHINGLPAEMNFGSIASSGLTAPTYNSNLSCSNTYCHGNFEFGAIKGNNYNPVWNIVDGTQAACGTCHGRINSEGVITSPTPVGHFGNFDKAACKNCHAKAFNEDGTLNKFTHIDGQKTLN